MNLSKSINLYPKPNTGKASQRLTVSSTSVSFATAFDITTQYVVLDIQGGDVMVLFSGTAPTASSGHLLKDGTSYTWSKSTASQAKFIRAAATDVAIQASQFTD
jgi:hypothetical protein